MPAVSNDGAAASVTSPADVPTITGSAVVDRDLHEIVTTPLPWSELRGKTVLVTGASGMIPAYAVYTLLALNETHGLDLTVLGMVRNLEKARGILGSVVDRADFGQSGPRH